MAKAAAPHKLYWNSQLIGVITEATFSDFPWVIGRFEARRVSKRLRAVLNWFAAQAEADELQDPPFAAELVEGWVIVKADGSRHELLMPPLIDFDKGYAEWR
ncbi:MAG: hypothetical protein ACJ8F7_00760 [Gemmataceae bacterium]